REDAQADAARAEGRQGDLVEPDHSRDVELAEVVFDARSLGGDRFGGDRVRSGHWVGPVAKRGTVGRCSTRRRALAMSGAAAPVRRALELLGPHAAAQAGLDLSAEADRTRWLVLSRLLSERAREEVALAAFARLSAAPGAAPEELVAAGPARV